jgi:hypothetical protein
MIFRALFVLIALLLAPPLAAQQPSTPAPDQHAATGLSFPPQLGQIEKKSSTDYGKAANRPDLGYSWNYVLPGEVSATVYVYQLNVDKIPASASNPIVLAQFQQAYGDIQALAHERYEDLKTTRPANDCPVAGVLFRCMTLSGIQIGDKRRINTSLLVTGYRNHFIKLRIDSVEGPKAEAAVASFLAAFASQLR